MAAAAVAVGGAGARARTQTTTPNGRGDVNGRAATATPGGDACIDEDVKADLFAKRKQRTSRDRLFQQTNRHELTVQGGYYVSDSSTAPYTVRRRVRVPHDRGLGGRGHRRRTRA